MGISKRKEPDKIIDTMEVKWMRLAAQQHQANSKKITKNRRIEK